MKTYSSILIHSSVAGGRCSGQIHLSHHGVFFTSSEMEYSIAFSQLEISAGGSGNRFIFFRDKYQKDVSIYTGDKTVLKHPDLKNYQSLKIDISKSKKISRSLLISSSIVVASVILIVAGLYLSKDLMIKKIAEKIPVEWEQKIGDKLFSTMSLSYTFVHNDSLKDEFLKVAKPLFSEIEKQGFVIDVYFVKDPTINAFALPGGKVLIQTGLIDNAKSWEEVLGVLSHEIAHVTRRHHIRSILNNVGIFALISLTFGDVSAIVATLGSVGGDLAALANSRTFEYEADETGWNYLVTTQINPHGMITFFETLQNKSKSKLDSTLNDVKGTLDLSFLSTHPDTQDRINILKAKEQALSLKYIMLPDNFATFKEKLLKNN